MDNINSEDKDVVDLECGRIMNEDDTNQGSIGGDRQARTLFHGNVGSLLGVDPHANSREERTQERVDLIEKMRGKAKRKRSNNKKAPKPPRPPKGPSLDAADVKLVKEISELAMKKRARIERMKALRKMKESKSSLPSKSSISALVITLLFILVLIFQGFGSKGSSHDVSFQGSPEPAATASSLISVQFYHNPSANDDNGPNSDFPYSVEQASGLDFPSPG